MSVAPMGFETTHAQTHVPFARALAAVPSLEERQRVLALHEVGNTAPDSEVAETVRLLARVQAEASRVLDAPVPIAGRKPQSLR